VLNCPKAFRNVSIDNPRTWVGHVADDTKDSEVASVERTLVVLKPDAVARGLVGRLIQRFEDAGFKIVGAKMKIMDAEFTRKHYYDIEERHGKAVYDATAAAMMRGPVLAVVIEGVEAVANIRRLVGNTYPNEAPPGTIRGDFAHQSKAYCIDQDKAVANLVHASGNADEAKQELDLWFTAEELFEYHTLAETFTF
jgi:nucleoside-diphosphate kinase